ncbi:uncharacterized protein [Amphiura filiformis]|uniref:uncharacterized protein n=1 Tax=Amphiura filiformis TaxID=82378 RepID=UPI003B21F04C
MRPEFSIPLLLLGTLSVCLAVPWVAEEYPNPMVNPNKCGSNIDGETLWLCDPDSVLGTDTSSVLSTVKDVNLNSNCVCNCTENPDVGYVVGVAVAEFITSQHDDQTASLEAFSQTVRENWFETSSCDDKILLLMVKNDSQIHLALGSRINEILPSEILDNIDRDIEPLLEASKYTEALELTLRQLDLAISERVGVYATGTDSTGMTTEEPPEPDNLVWGILGVIAIMSILIFHYWIKY